MGSGKTTFGKKLSIKLNYEFVDTDKYIEKKEEMTISEIFEKFGESYFRDLEKNTISEISVKSGFIVSTGGGIIKNEENIKMLKKNGIIVYLKATPEQIYRNIGEDKNRPLLQNCDKMEKIKELLSERTPYYEKYCDVSVDVSGGTVNQITDRILKTLEGII